jgi:hypothetical protein
VDNEDRMAELIISGLSVESEGSGGKHTSLFLHICYFYTWIFPFIPHQYAELGEGPSWYVEHIKFTLEQATKTQRGSKDIALLFL